MHCARTIARGNRRQARGVGAFIRAALSIIRNDLDIDAAVAYAQCGFECFDCADALCARIINPQTNETKWSVYFTEVLLAHR